MTDTPDKNDAASPAPSAKRASDQAAEPGKRRRRSRRVVLVSLGSVLAVAIAAAIGIYAYVNHAVSSIPRVHVGHLAASGPGQTFLITGSPWQPTGTPVQGVQAIHSKLVMLLHINADGRTGGVVGISGDTVVNVPGLGFKPLWEVYKAGGPSLLVQAVNQLTGVPINHFAEIDLDNLTSLVDAVGGVTVTLPAASSNDGHLFTGGVNHLTGITATYYAFDNSLTDQAELLRQENVLRALLDKIAADHLLTSPITAIRVLNTITGALTVDSNMSNSEIESLARKLGGLGSDAATFVIAPTQTVHGMLMPNTALADQLWTALKKNSIANFAKAFPATVAPQVVA